MGAGALHGAQAFGFWLLAASSRLRPSESCLPSPGAAIGLHGTESPSNERINKSCKAAGDLLDFNIGEIMRTFLLACNITGPNRITTGLYPCAFPGAGHTFTRGSDVLSGCSQPCSFPKGCPCPGTAHSSSWEKIATFPFSAACATGSRDGSHTGPHSGAVGRAHTMAALFGAEHKGPFSTAQTAPSPRGCGGHSGGVQLGALGQALCRRAGGGNSKRSAFLLRFIPLPPPFFFFLFPIPKQPSCVFCSPVNHSSSSGKGGKKHMIQARKHAGRWGELAEDSRAEPCAGTGAATSRQPPPCLGCSRAGTAQGWPGMGSRAQPFPAAMVEVLGGAMSVPAAPLWCRPISGSLKQVDTPCV